MSLFYLGAGMNHFVNPDFYLPMIPSYLPAPKLLNLLSGAAELLLAMMLMRPEVRSLGAWGVILLLIAVFPANVHMFMQGGAAYGVPDWAMLVRLPLQLVLILWAYWHTKNPELDRHLIATEIAIEASPQKVWSVLTNFKNYPTWNPFIESVHGELRVGGEIEIRIRPSEGEPIRFQNKIAEVRTNEALAWRGSFIARGFFDGTHSFRLEGLNERSAEGKIQTRLVQSEEFVGVLTGLLKGFVSDKPKNFHAMNRALKAQCEK